MKPITPKPNLGLRNNMLYRLVEHACANPDVRHEVVLNHDENRWWPLSVSDWRLRMLLAGWSTRVSYSSIESYQSVVENAKKYGFDTLCDLDEKSLMTLLKPIGLFAARLTYFESLRDEIASLNADYPDPLKEEDDVLIERLAKNVKGASYKVAQCAVLYAKGYYCGVMPVDSGMCEMLEAVIGDFCPTYPHNHELIRTNLQECVREFRIEYELLMKKAHESELQSGGGVNGPTWWVHLVLIYYKRLYWNKGRSSFLTHRATSPSEEARSCSKPDISAYPLVVVEGPASRLKNEFVERLVRCGFSHTLCDVRGWDCSQLALLNPVSLLPKGAVVTDLLLPGIGCESDVTSIADSIAENNGVVIYVEPPAAIIEEDQSNSVERRKFRKVAINVLNSLDRIVPVVVISLEHLGTSWWLAMFESR